MYTEQEYNAARVICDKATAYWEAHCSRSRSGWSSLTAEQAAHPDFAACTTEMRGRVEQYELHRDKPERFTGYVTGANVATWNGMALGKVTWSGHWQRNNFGGRWRAVTMRADWGDTYHGREYASRQFVNWRKAAH